MGQFRKDTKTLIVNSAGQLVVQKPDGTAVTAGTDPIVSLSGFLDILYTEDWTGNVPQGKPQLVAPGVKEIAVDAKKEVKTFKVTTAGSTEWTRIILAYTSISGEQAEFHNHPKRKYYQIAPGADAIALANNIVAAINADENAPVVAKIDDRPDDTSGTTPVKVSEDNRVVLTPKEMDLTTETYTEDLALDKTPVSAISVTGTVGRNTYRTLKNKFWSNPISDSSEFDRRADFVPRAGAKYTAFRFETKTDVGYLGSQEVADADKGRLSYSEYLLFVNEELTELITSLNHAVVRV